MTKRAHVEANNIVISTNISKYLQLSTNIYIYLQIRDCYERICASTVCRPLRQTQDYQPPIWKTEYQNNETDDDDDDDDGFAQIFHGFILLVDQF